MTLEYNSLKLQLSEYKKRIKLLKAKIKNGCHDSKAIEHYKKIVNDIKLKLSKYEANRNTIKSNKYRSFLFKQNDHRTNKQKLLHNPLNIIPENNTENNINTITSTRKTIKGNNIKNKYRSFLFKNNIKHYTTKQKKTINKQLLNQPLKKIPENNKENNNS